MDPKKPKSARALILLRSGVVRGAVLSMWFVCVRSAQDSSQFCAASLVNWLCLIVAFAVAAAAADRSMGWPVPNDVRSLWDAPERGLAGGLLSGWLACRDMRLYGSMRKLRHSRWLGFACFFLLEKLCFLTVSSSNLFVEEYTRDMIHIYLPGVICFPLISTVFRLRFSVLCPTISRTEIV